MKEQAEVRTLKVGRYMVVDDEPCKILSITTSKPGKHGSAKARIDVESVFTGSKKSVVYTVTDKIYVPMIEKKRAQVISKQGSVVQLMDSETYDTFEMDVPEGYGGELTPGGEVSYWDAMGRRMLRE